MLQLDHLAVAASTLDDATAYVETSLGVRMQPGGQHAVFGTHNRLLGLSDGLYFEAIAIDPDAATPERARWFDLDNFTGPARLSNWVCRVDDLAAALAVMGEGYGEIVALTRGDLRWRMAVPRSGILPFGGMAPALIEWQVPVTPGDVLASSGCTLQHLTVRAPDASALQAALAGVLKDARVSFETGDAGLYAMFSTPQGDRRIG